MSLHGINSPFQMVFPIFPSNILDLTKLCHWDIFIVAPPQKLVLAPGTTVGGIWYFEFINQLCSIELILNHLPGLQM